MPKRVILVYHCPQRHSKRRRRREGGTLLSDLYGEAPSKRGTFFSLQHKRRDFSSYGI